MQKYFKLIFIPINALKEFIVNGDGNCQFRAISDQLYGDQSHHASVRAVVVAQMRARPDRYAAFVESPSTTSIAAGSQTYGWTDASSALRDGRILLSIRTDSKGITPLLHVPLPASLRRQGNRS